MTKFTIEEKLNAVKRYLNGNEGHNIISASIGVHKSLLNNWVQQYKIHGEKAFEKGYRL